MGTSQDRTRGTTQKPRFGHRSLALVGWIASALHSPASSRRPAYGYLLPGFSRLRSRALHHRRPVRRARPLRMFGKNFAETPRTARLIRLNSTSRMQRVPGFSIWPRKPIIFPARSIPAITNWQTPGAKKLAYKDGQRESAATYNFSPQPAIQQLTALFQGVAATLEFGRRLAHNHRYQKLALDEELKQMEDQARRGDLVEVQAVRPHSAGDL